MWLDLQFNVVGPAIQCGWTCNSMWLDLQFNVVEPAIQCGWTCDWTVVVSLDLRLDLQLNLTQSYKSYIFGAEVSNKNRKKEGRAILN